MAAQPVVHHQALQPRRVQAALTESGAPPWLPRPCCGLPMPIDFNMCCTVNCDNCRGQFCARCLGVWWRGGPVEGGQTRAGTPYVLRNGDGLASARMHDHVRLCLATSGNTGHADWKPADGELLEQLDNTTYYANPQTAKEVSRAWHWAFLAHHLQVRAPERAAQQLNALRSLSDEQLHAVVNALGFPLPRNVLHE